GDGDGDVELAILPKPARSRYACPGWANTRYLVLHTNRVAGKPGLLAWERPEVIAQGIRGLARRILATDKRLRPAPEPKTVPLEQVVVAQDGGKKDAENGDGKKSAPQEPAADPGPSTPL